jgi:uncharacterized protein (DUF2141 family)
MKAILLFILFYTLQINANAQAQPIELLVKVKGFKNTKGTVKFQLVDENEKEVLTFVSTLTEKTFTWKVNVYKVGKYAVNVIHDKNNNDKLDTNAFGIPKEGWGCSNDARGTLAAPKFKDKLFELKVNKTITINLVHY